MQKSADAYTAILADRRTTYQKRHDMIKDWEDWYYLNHYEGKTATDVVKSDESSPSYKHVDTTPFDYINQLIAMAMVAEISRECWTDDDNTSQKAQDVCDAAEKFLRGAWEINRKRARLDPLAAIMFDQLVRAGSYVYVYIDVDRLKLYKKSDKGLPRPSYFPFCIDRLDPMTCFPDPLPGRWSWTDSFIRAEAMTPRQVANMWGERKVADLFDEFDIFDEEHEKEANESEIDYIDIWEFDTNDDGAPTLMNGVIYNEKWLIKPRAVDEHYADLPIRYIPAWELPSKELEKRAISPLQPVIQHARTLERIINRVMTGAAFNADPIMIRRGMRMMAVKKGPGQVVDLDDPQQQVYYLQGPQVNPQLLQIFQLVSADLERSSLARVSYGQAPGSWSGYMANQAISGSSLKNQVVIRNLREGLSSIDELLLAQAAAAMGNDKITAYGTLGGNKHVVKIKGKELEGIHCNTYLDPKTPSDEQAKAGLGQMYRTPGAGGTPLMPDEWIQKNILGVEDVTALRKALYKEKLMSLPTIQKFTLLNAIDESDWPPEVKKQAAAELEQEMGMGKPKPGAGGPAGPGGAPAGPAGMPGGMPAAPSPAMPAQGAPPQMPAQGGQPPAMPQAAGQVTAQQAVEQLALEVQNGNIDQAMAQSIIMVLEMMGVQPEEPVDMEMLSQVVDMVKQGIPPEQIVAQLQGGAQPMPPEQGQMPQEMGAAAMSPESIPAGELTLQQAAQFLQQQGRPDLIPTLQMLIQQQGLTPTQALQMVMATEVEAAANEA